MQTTKELLVEQLQDLYDAENQLLIAIPKAHAKASNEELQDTLGEHLKETANHITRLEEIFLELDEPAVRKTCQGMQGLIAEVEEAIAHAENDSVRDFAIIAQALRIEHYEKAGYIITSLLAERLDLPVVKELLEDTLAEEENAANMLESFVTETFWDKVKSALGEPAYT